MKGVFFLKKEREKSTKEKCERSYRGLDLSKVRRGLCKGLDLSKQECLGEVRLISNNKSEL